MIVYNYKIMYIGFEFKEEPFNNSEFVTSPWYTYIDYINIYIGGREIETWVTDRRIPKEKKSNYDVLLIVSSDALVVGSLSVKDLNHLWLCPPCSRGTSSIFHVSFVNLGPTCDGSYLVYPIILAIILIWQILAVWLIHIGILLVVHVISEFR